MKKRILLALGLVSLLALAGCGKKAADTNTSESASESVSESAQTSAVSKDLKIITVGATPAPHAEILEAAREALNKEGYDLKIVEYNDYIQPNVALDTKELDANYFQHYPYLENFNKEHNTTLVSAGAIHYEPFGIYAGKTASLDALADGAKISVPNDATNEARALLLLQDNGIIKLKDGAGLTATKQDVVENPHNIELYEVEAAQIPRSLDSVDFACMNGNFALQANLKPSDALVVEKADSEAAQTYANIVAVAEKNKDAEWAKTLVEVLQSKEIQDFINKKYDGGVVPIQ